jgi:CRP-like cAMP-binding protein
MDRDEILKRVPMFAALPANALADISRLFIRTTYVAGDYIFFENDPADRLYVVQSGEVKLIKHSESGQDVILEVFAAGQVFGGIAFLVGKHYPATAQAQTDVTVLSIPSETFRDIVQRYPDVALTIIRVLGTRLMDTQEQVRQLVAERVERRLARMLLKLADQVGVAADEGVRIDMPITRQDLAEMTGTTLETVSRIISRWRREGIVEAGREEIVITHPHGLVLIAEDLGS